MQRKQSIVRRCKFSANFTATSVRLSCSASTNLASKFFTGSKVLLNIFNSMSGMAMSFSLAKSILRDVSNSSINSCGMCSFQSPSTANSLGKVFKWPNSQAVLTNSLSKLTESADVDSTSWERNHAKPSSLSIRSSCATKELMGTLAP